MIFDSDETAAAGIRDCRNNRLFRWIDETGSLKLNSDVCPQSKSRLETLMVVWYETILAALAKSVIKKIKGCRKRRIQFLLESTRMIWTDRWSSCRDGWSSSCDSCATNERLNVYYLLFSHCSYCYYCMVAQRDVSTRSMALLLLHSFPVHRTSPPFGVSKSN